MSFSPTVNYAAGADPQEIVSADFNNDGQLDLYIVDFREASHPSRPLFFFQ